MRGLTNSSPAQGNTEGEAMKETLIFVTLYAVIWLAEHWLLLLGVALFLGACWLAATQMPRGEIP